MRKSKKERSQAELARLLYVALTRARDRIYFVDTWPYKKSPQAHFITLRNLLFCAKDSNPDLFDALMPILPMNTPSSSKGE